MRTQPSDSENEKQSAGHVVREILSNCQELIRQEVQLAKAELKTGWMQLRGAAYCRAGGAFTLMLGTFFLSFAAVEGLQASGLAPWASRAIVGAVLCGVGAGLWNKAFATKLETQTQEKLRVIRSERYQGAN